MRTPTWTWAVAVFACAACSNGAVALHDAGPPKDATQEDSPTGPGCGAGGQACCAQKKCNPGFVCGGGFCVAPPTDAGDSGSPCAFTFCDGRCTDTFSDSENCGRCGHDCVDSPCSSSLCRARGIAMGVSPVHLATDATHVYFTDVDGTVDQVPSAGGTVVRLATGMSSPNALAVDATHVYFTARGTAAKGFSDGAVYRARTDGVDAGAPAAIATGRTNPQAIAVDATSVYWLEPGTTTDGALLTCPRSGCPKNAPKVVYGMLAFPVGLAVDDGQIYVTTSAGGQVVAFDKATDAARILVDMQQQPAGITVEKGKVYWATPGDGLVQAMPVDGGPTAFIATTMGLPQVVAADAVNVYWNDQNPSPITTLGTVDSCALEGCPPDTPVTLVDPSQTASDIAIDAQFIYWIGVGGGIVRVAK